MGMIKFGCDRHGRWLRNNKDGVREEMLEIQTVEQHKTSNNAALSFQAYLPTRGHRASDSPLTPSFHVSDQILKDQRWEMHFGLIWIVCHSKLHLLPTTPFQKELG